MFRALVYSDIWIGVACAMQVAFTYLLIGHAPNVEVMLWAGLSTVAVYNWQRLIRVGGLVPEIYSDRHRWIKRNRYALWLLFAASMAGAFYILVQFSDNFIRSVFLLSILAFFYTLPSNVGENWKGLRDLPYLKVFLIAVCWTGVTAFLPLLYEQVPSWLSLPVLGERFIFILAITIPFDVRDLTYDSRNKRTLPQVLGIRSALGLAIVFGIVATVLVSYILYLGKHSSISCLVVLIGYLATLRFIKGTTLDRSELYFTGLLDGMLVLIPLSFWMILKITGAGFLQT
jgi:hypothetical protein